MIILDKKVNDLTIPEMAHLIDTMVDSGYIQEFVPTKQPNEMIDCVLEMVDYSDSEIIEAALHLNVEATNLGTTCVNGFNEWSFKGIDSNMRRWYNEFYCQGTPENHNGYEFDVLRINS